MYTPITSDQCVTLQELGEPIRVGGESDWRVALYVYVITDTLRAAGYSEVAPGVYVREESGSTVIGYSLPTVAQALSLADVAESQYVAWQSRGIDPNA